MLTSDQLKKFYGGLPVRETVRAEGPGWGIETPAIFVPGANPIGVLVQGGLHSQYAQLSHIVRRFVRAGFPVVCLSQSGAADVERSGFYTADFSHFVERDLAILNAFGIRRAIVYGSSIGAAAAIALAAEVPDRVVAVIAVNPSSLIRQKRWWLAMKFFLAAFQKVERVFTPPPRRPPSPIGILGEFGEALTLSASDTGLEYLAQTRCPVLIYSGRQDRVFPCQRLKRLERWFFNVRLTVLDNFVHSDPNSEAKINHIVTDALKRI